MHTNAEGTETRIEKSGYAQNTIRYCKEESQRPVSQPALKTVQSRALDGRVLETYLPEGSMVQSFMDVISTSKESN